MSLKWVIFKLFRYTLLVGKPPFETTSLKETYQRIKQNEYYIPSKVPQSAQMLIIKMLRPEPNSRPTMKEVCVTRSIYQREKISVLLDSYFQYLSISRNAANFQKCYFSQNLHTAILKLLWKFVLNVMPK